MFYYFCIVILEKEKKKQKMIPIQRINGTGIGTSDVEMHRMERVVSSSAITCMTPSDDMGNIFNVTNNFNGSNAMDHVIMNSMNSMMVTDGLQPLSLQLPPAQFIDMVTADGDEKMIALCSACGVSGKGKNDSEDGQFY
eukprot:UN05213